MQERVRKRAYKRRPNGHVELEIAPDLKISVEVYNLVRSLNKPTAVKLSKRTNEEVLAITNTFTKETGQLLMSDDVVKTQEYGGKKFAFSQAEAREIKSILKDPIIRIVGFTKLDTVVKQEPSEPDPADPDTVINKPLKHMKLQHHVAPASFIYPDEKNIKGSTKLFKALLSRCFVRGVAPIAWFMPRRNVNLRLVALVPETDDDDVGGNRLTPPGFHVVPLPYAGSSFLLLLR
ncbi:unnamed protein product [Notodromas monacha]|uniref:Ku domain-containing protein n=1 Tax=Notodromas monacha TaxID=399045 RepID=A0A7R9GKN8_9CRUS|nr:unnamed protein product [Notodromas monacha]CAG0924973.1 unnamed protein product [Notodromas monacha]